MQQGGVCLDQTYIEDIKDFSLVTLVGMTSKPSGTDEDITARIKKA